MVLPVAAITRPTDLASVSNGKLPDSLLASHTFPGHGRPARAHPLTLRSFRAMAAGCRAATGVTLTITSNGDAYRTFDQQLAVFEQRYVQVSHKRFLNDNPKTRRTFNGRFFVLRNPKFAVVASPGKSNHGLGLALDVAVVDGTRVSELFLSECWPWVRNHAESFGFSWETQSEPWHLRLVTGDNVPQPVIDHEGGAVAPVVRSLVAPTPTANLIVDAPPAEPSELIIGVSDPHRVRWLQAILNQRGWGELSINGRFDAATESAVTRMQRDLGVRDDGRYGRKTATALSRFLSKAA